MSNAEQNWLTTTANGDPSQLIYTGGEAHHTMFALKFAFHPIYDDNDLFYAQHTDGKTGYLTDLFKTLKKENQFDSNSIGLIRKSQ